MSLADVVYFTSQDTVKQNTAGPVLLAVFEQLVRQTIILCDTKGYDLNPLEAFSLSTNEWQTQLL